MLPREVVAPAAVGVVVLAAAVATTQAWTDWPAAGRWLVEHAVVVVLFGAAAIALATAGVRYLRVRRAPWQERDVQRTLSWWMVAAAGIVVAAVGWAATDWLLDEAASAKDPAAARVDAIKTGLSIAAGTGGVFALLLAVRRQWHQERATASTVHDAAERRVTELYTKAADQLGSDKAPVRLAGLYALERVAQDNPGQRQTVVNVLCAYLRMPYTPPRTSPRRLGVRRPRRTGAPAAAATPPPAATPLPAVASGDTAQQELEVRLTAQRILVEHLKLHDNDKINTLWEDIDLDLTGATLHEWDMNGCRVRRARFDGAKFDGVTQFYKTHFDGSAEFLGAQFSGRARFDGAIFNKFAVFRATRFIGPADFDHARFRFPGNFKQAVFGSEATFSEAKSSLGTMMFVGTRFDRRALFIAAQFVSGADFSSAQFMGPAVFDHARLDRHILFKAAQFAGRADFSSTQFMGPAVFDEARFVGGASAAGVLFDNGTPPEFAAAVQAGISNNDDGVLGSGRN